MVGTPVVKHYPDSQLGLGIRTLSIAPNKKHLACGMYSQNLTVYNQLT